MHDPIANYQMTTQKYQGWLIYMAVHRDALCLEPLPQSPSLPVHVGAGVMGVSSRSSSGCWYDDGDGVHSCSVLITVNNDLEIRSNN